MWNSMAFHVQGRETILDTPEHNIQVCRYPHILRLIFRHISLNTLELTCLYGRACHTPVQNIQIYSILLSELSSMQTYIKERKRHRVKKIQIHVPKKGIFNQPNTKIKKRFHQ